MDKLYMVKFSNGHQSLVLWLPHFLFCCSEMESDYTCREHGSADIAKYAWELFDTWFESRAGVSIVSIDPLIS